VMNPAAQACDDQTADFVDLDGQSSDPLVLHVRSIAGHGGGPEKTILNSPRFLKQLGYRSACAFLHRPSELEALRRRADEAQATLVSVRDGGVLDFGVASRVAKLCRALRPAIWHAHEYKSNILGVIVRRLVPLKLVTTVHGWGSLSDGHLKTRAYKAIDKRSLRHFDAVIAVSADIFDECLARGVPSERCHLIRNAIDLGDFRRTLPRSEARQAFPFPVKGCLIGAMGRLAEEKGFGVLIRAVARLIADGHDLSLWIAGEGQLKAELQSLVDGLGCEDRIRLLGHVSPARSFFEALDLFVLSSYDEGLPNVVLEAMAMEVPVVATRVAGIPSLIQDGENGILISSGSVDAICQAVQHMVQNHVLAERLTRNALRTLEEFFSFEKRMRAVARVYESLLA